jgi:hypothetical protein
MLPNLDEVAGSMRSGPAWSGAARTLGTGALGTGDTGDDIGGEGLVAVKTRQDAFPLRARFLSTICTVWTTFLYNR